MATSSHSSCLSSSSSVIHVCPHLALAFGSCSCSTQVTKKRKRPHQETRKNKTNNVPSSLLNIYSYPKTIVCLHLSLSVCSCLVETQTVKKPKPVYQQTHVSTTNNTCNALAVGTNSDCSTNFGDPWMIKKVLTKSDLDETRIVKKQKRVHQEINVSTTNKACNAVAVGSNSDFSTNVRDPWMIKKVVTKSDLDDNCRLLLNKVVAKKWVVPVVDKAKAENDGVEVEVFDVDTGFPLSLNFKIRPSNDSHVFNTTWIKDFVDRRNLKKGDEIGLKWNEEKKRFDFSVLHRS